MKNQTFHPIKQVNRYVYSCMLALALFLVSCETSLVEELPHPLPAAASTDVALKQPNKELPHQEIARLRAAVAPYHNIEKALADGYTIELTDYRSQMGIHYLKPSLLDEHFELERPEVLMYVKEPNNRMRLVGVEYAVPIADMNNIPPAPEGFTGNADEWAVNDEFDVWTLHVWVGLSNPHGIFSPHNPRLP